MSGIDDVDVVNGLRLIRKGVQSVLFEFLAVLMKDNSLLLSLLTAADLSLYRFFINFLIFLVGCMLRLHFNVLILSIFLNLSWFGYLLWFFNRLGLSFRLISLRSGLFNLCFSGLRSLHTRD